MKTTEITVPSRYRYLSERMEYLPSNCILNKGMCGCGGTTLELTSDRDSLILVPTVNLVLNKAKDGVLGVTGDTTNNEIEEYMSSPVTYKKIMCTYDSLKRILSYVDVDRYFLLIDEYHLLFYQYSFRYDAISFVLKSYGKFRNFCFLSATPLTEENTLDELKDIDVINMRWEGKNPVELKNTVTPQYVRAVLNRIDDYKDTDVNLHIFVNSVGTIKKIISKMDEHVSFRTVCSPSNKDKSNVNYQGINSKVMKVNFYTSTAFEGADIFDENGKTIVVSDTRIASTISDISTFIPQIAGRIRDSKYINQIEYIFSAESHRYYNKSKTEFKMFVEENKTNGRIILQGISKMEKREYNATLSVFHSGLDELRKSYINIYDDKLFYDNNLRLIDIDNYNQFKVMTTLYTQSPHQYFSEVKKQVMEKPKDSCFGGYMSIYESELYKYIDKGVRYRKDVLLSIMDKHDIVDVDKIGNRFFTLNFSDFKTDRHSVNGKQHTFYTFY